MGRELILKKINTGANLQIILGVILTLIFSFGVFVFIVGDFLPMAIILLLADILFIVMFIMGIRIKKDPKKSPFVKRNPKLLELAEELFSGVLYEDDYIIFSDKVIASKQQITQMTEFDDILWICEKKMTCNGITTSHTVSLMTAKQTIDLSVYAKKKDMIAELMAKIYERCPNAVVGYSAENQQYYNEKRKELKALEM